MSSEVQVASRRAVVASVQLPDVSDVDFESSLDELREMAKTLGFEVVATFTQKRSSFDTSADLSASDLRNLVTAIKAEGVKAVFSESSLPAKTAASIAADAGVKVVEGDDALYGDGLGPAGSDGATYLTMMRHNAQTIASSLR